MKQEETAENESCYTLSHVVKQLRLGKYAEALKHIEPIVLQHLPNCWEVRYQYALMYWSEGNASKSIEIYKTWLRENPNDADAWRTFAFYLENHQGAAEEIVNCYKHAAKSDPFSANLWLSLGGAYTNVGDLENAIVAYSKALDLDPLLLPAQIDLALAYIEAGLISEAKGIIDLIPQSFNNQSLNSADWTQEIMDLNIKYKQAANS